MISPLGVIRAFGIGEKPSLLLAEGSFHVCIERRPMEVLATFNAAASRMAISVITLAELLHGAKKAAAPPRTFQ